MPFLKSLCLLFLALGALCAQGRLVRPLNEGWQFAKWNVPELKGLDAPAWLPVTLPHTWNAQDAQSGEGMYTGIGWYRRSLEVPPEWKGKRVFLRFEGVGSVADVYVNGRHLGQHRGAYAAFCVDLTPALVPGPGNEILVRADNSIRPDVLPTTYVLFAVFGGIYRPASLLVTDPIHITPMDCGSPGVFLRQAKVDRERAEVEVRVKVANAAGVRKALVLRTEVRDGDGRIVARAAEPVTIRPAGLQVFTQGVRIEHPHLWDGRRDPYLYRATVALLEGDRILDAVEQPLGLRFFRMDEQEGFFLNGRSYPLRGVCRHQEREGQGSALTEADHQQDLALMAEIGASSLRLAHYQQAETIYAGCDRIGFLVWAEIPFVAGWTGQEGENARQQLRELIRQNCNHPSIFAWGLCNEVSAKDEADFPVQLVRELQDEAKGEDPDRFTTSASNHIELGYPMAHLSDLQGFNLYYGWYGGRAADLETWARTPKGGAGTLNALSEYGAEGNWRQQSENDQVPGDPLAGQFYPEGYQTRTHETELAIIERSPQLWGAYVWNMFDFTCPFWHRGGVPGRNQKGLVSYDRKVKKDAFFLYKAAWNPEPMVHLADRRLALRTRTAQVIHGYCNLDHCRLSLNGRDLGEGQVAGPRVHRTWAVTLAPGANTLVLSASARGAALKDEIQLDCRPSTTQEHP